MSTVKYVDINGLSHFKDKMVDVYSTTEVKTNKIWTNNKPIYRKVFSLSNYGTLQNGSNVSCAIANIETLTYQDITYYYGTKAIKLPLVESSGNTLQGSYDVSSQKIAFSGSGSWQSRTMIAIFEYTKTTD